MKLVNEPKITIKPIYRNSGGWGSTDQAFTRIHKLLNYPPDAFNIHVEPAEYTNSGMRNSLFAAWQLAEHMRQYYYVTYTPSTHGSADIQISHIENNEDIAGNILHDVWTRLNNEYR